MDGKGRWGARSWEFSDHTSRSNSVSKPTLGIPIPEGSPTGYTSCFLKMSSYSDRNALIGEPSSEASPMDFPWGSQRNFMSSTKNMTHQVNSEVNEVANMPTCPMPPESTFQNGEVEVEVETKRTKNRKRQTSTKKTKSVATKVLRPKEPKKNPSMPKKKKESSAAPGRREKKNQDDNLEGEILDFSSVPTPVCSCTGVLRQCYRWGAGGWQSSCCTTSISEYPLPMSSSRPGARLAGRKMSISAYGKLLRRLAAEGHDLSYAVDLKNHWARHGTNKFVTIR